MDKEIKEKLKSLVLVLLIIAMPIAMYLNWPEHVNTLKVSELFNFGKTEEENGEAIEIENVIDIKCIEVVQKNGNVKYADNEKESFVKILKELKNFSTSYETQVTESLLEGYLEAREDFRSITICFGVEVPFQEFVESAGLGRGRNYNRLEGFDEITISTAYNNYIFFRNSKDDCCYTLSAIGDIKDNLAEKLIKEISLKSYEDKKAENVFGLGYAYIPSRKDEGIGIGYVNSQDYSDYEAEAIARNIFGKSFDFARKVVDIYGAVSYNYNYGEKVLSISRGEIKYNSTTRKSGSKSVFADIAAAKDFLESSQLLVNVNGISYKLSNLSKEEIDGYTVRKLGFTASLNGVDIYTNGDNISLTIEVQNGQVISFAMSTIKLVSVADGDTLSARDAARLAIENSKEIYKEINGKEAASSDEAYNFVCENIEDIELVYQRSGLTILVPYWKIRVKGTDLYYGYY